MLVHVLAVDYDGTIAVEGRVAPPTAAALQRVRESGRRLVLVTGRMLPDLRAVFPGVDQAFDAVVAENGALLYLPERREVRVLGDPPEAGLVEALGRHRVPFTLGTSIVATQATWAGPALAAIREAGVERALVFNKDALMLVPGGVSKGPGLGAALEALQLSPHNLVGIGDAENDHAFLALCECAVAVADAVEALRQRADHVTRGPAGRGVVEFVEEHLLDDAAGLIAGLTRHRLELGRAGDGPVSIPAHATRLLVVGPSASGKSTLTGVLVERLIEAGRTLCLLDPEGDHGALAELERVVGLGGGGERALPTAEELQGLLRRPDLSLVLNLSRLSRAEKVAYATEALGAVAAVRAAAGLPHWLLVDEAHHIAPAEGSPAVSLLHQPGQSLALITLSADMLAPPLRRDLQLLASTDAAAFGQALRALGAPDRPLDGAGGRALEQGEALLARLGGGPGVERFRIAPRGVPHRRHLRKYAEGELPPDTSFYFRGPAGALNLRAANLKRFCELAEGVDEATWGHHLRRRDYSTWLRDVVKDRGLAEEVAALEGEAAPPDARPRVLEAIRRRYAV